MALVAPTSRCRAEAGGVLASVRLGRLHLESGASQCGLHAFGARLRPRLSGARPDGTCWHEPGQRFLVCFRGRSRHSAAHGRVRDA
jgi:hypothetical protein